MADPLSLHRLHRRHLQQAGWTREIRRRILSSLGEGARGPWIDIGAGTGAVARDLVIQVAARPLVALDIDLEACRYGSSQVPSARWGAADAHHLPLASDCCAAAFFHFVLLWLRDPDAALAEATRVVRTGGWVVALAEPDHRARLDHPEGLAEVGALQTRALAAQGADVHHGRRLGSLFSRAGLDHIQLGLLGGEWKMTDAPDGLEWEMLRSDLDGALPPSELDRYQDLDRKARSRGERVLFVPTFFALGRVR
jgi:SAM-dependent methyltransferase